MNIKDYQLEVDKWAKQFDPAYFPPFEILARLMEEIGELSRETSHIHGIKKKKSTELEGRVEDELGDIIFTVICYANKSNIDLDQCIRDSISKCYRRDNDRYKKK